MAADVEIRVVANTFLGAEDEKPEIPAGGQLWILLGRTDEVDAA